MLLSILCIYQVLKDYKRYQNMDDDDSEELYRAMNRKHSYATVFNGVATSVAMVSLVLSFKVTFASDKAELFFLFLILSLSWLVVSFKPTFSKFIAVFVTLKCRLSQL